MTVRPALVGDIPALAAILAANDEPMDWPDLPALGWPYLDHLLARARAVVAEVEGSVAGFAGFVPVGREDVGFLTDHYVDLGLAEAEISSSARVADTGRASEVATTVRRPRSMLIVRPNRRFGKDSTFRGRRGGRDWSGAVPTRK